MKDKKLILKFEILTEIDTSNQNGDTYNDKLENFKQSIEKSLNYSFSDFGEVDYNINCVDKKIEDY